MTLACHDLSAPKSNRTVRPAVSPPLSKRLASEALGTALLLVAIVGSGISGEQWSGGNETLALLPHALSVGAALVALISCFGGVSAHFNPAVTIAEALGGRFAWREVPAYVGVQVVAACFGTVLTHVMFGIEPVVWGQNARTGAGLWLGEFVATFGLLTIILGSASLGTRAIATAVGTYICGAIWFTPSAAFANPAVTVARALTDTYVSIRPLDVPPYVVAQFAGGILGSFAIGWIVIARPSKEARADEGAEAAKGGPEREVLLEGKHSEDAIEPAR